MVKMLRLFIVSLVVINSALGDQCFSDSDCRSLNNCEDGQCVHKTLWPLSFMEAFGLFLIIFVSALANAGGVGGGQIMLPILMVVFAFDTHMAIPLCQVIICGGALIAIGLKIQSRHPTKNRPLIQYELILLMISPLLLGTTYGVMLNQMFPDWLIELLLTLLMIYITFKSVRM